MCSPKRARAGQEELTMTSLPSSLAQTLMSYPGVRIKDSNTEVVAAALLEVRNGGWTGALPHHLYKPPCLRKGAAADLF